MTSTIPAALVGKRLAVCDVEGNGQNPPEIIECGLLTIDDEITTDNLRAWLIRPQQPVTAIVAKIHGITNDDVADCPAWPEVAPRIGGLLTDRVLVAHSATVEHRVLSAHLPHWRPPMVLDTLRLARQVWPGLDSYSLTNLSQYAALDTSAITEQEHHRARYDTWCAWQLLCVLIDHGRYDWPDLVKVAALSDFLPAEEPEGGPW
jgi:DNA polymerase III epsilon subunit-like protein